MRITSNKFRVNLTCVAHFVANLVSKNWYFQLDFTKQKRYPIQDTLHSFNRHGQVLLPQCPLFKYLTSSHSLEPSLISLSLLVQPFFKCHVHKQISNEQMRNPIAEQGVEKRT